MGQSSGANNSAIDNLRPGIKNLKSLKTARILMLNLLHGRDMCRYRLWYDNSEWKNPGRWCEVSYEHGILCLQSKSIPADPVYVLMWNRPSHLFGY